MGSTNVDQEKNGLIRNFMALENHQKYLHAYQNAYVKKEKKIGIQSTISLHPRESIGMLSDLGSMLTITKAIHNSCGFVYPI